MVFPAKTRRNRNNTNRGKPLIADAYVITMNMESERYKQTEASAKAANLPIKKWDAVKVDESMRDSLMEQGIGSIIFKGATMRYRGAIGCFLAHRGVMRHIAEQASHATQGTLILEDDVKIPPDFLQKIQSIVSELPADWDILYLDKVNPKSEKVTEHIFKFQKQMTTANNWGNWAYIVRNSSLKERILPLLEFMIEPVDIQLHKFADYLHIYQTVPSLITLNEATTKNSNINKLNMNGGTRRKRQRKQPQKQKRKQRGGVYKPRGDKPRILLCKRDEEKYFKEYMDSIADGDTILLYDDSTTLDDNKYYVCLRVIPYDKIPPNCSIGYLNTEQLTDLRRLDEYNKTVRPGIDIYDYSMDNIRITGKGTFLPYKERKEETNKLRSFLNVEKEFDVCIVGNQSDRRDSIIAKLRSNGIVVNSGISVNSITNIWGDERDRQIGLSRILLNIHAYDSYKIYESLRCDRWKFAGMPIISEKSISPPPDGVIEFTFDTVVDVVKKKLESLQSK